MLLVVALLAFLLILLGFSFLTWRQLVRIHPRRRRLITVTVIVCSLWWPFLPLFNARTDFSRFIRSLLGPPWTAWITFALFYSILLFLILIVWLPMRHRRRFEDVARWPSRVFITLVIVGGVVGIYQALVPLRVERVPVMIDNLPPELDGTRLALIADLHTGLFTRPSRLEEIFTTTAALQPHAVFLLGDMLDDDPYYIPKLLAGMRPLPTQTPVFAVLGNHEMYNVPREVIADLRGSRV
ncbi:MAG TPA: metallophosphoesterase, partial [Thermoanaerobaculia bacterium]|nr:metallophosphoesterase [Thermoanaerobaculia bacterium]